MNVALPFILLVVGCISIDCAVLYASSPISLTTALINAVDGDTIQLSPSVFPCNPNYIVTKSLMLIGTNVVFDCAALDRALVVNGQSNPISVTIAGITFQNGRAKSGGAIAVSGNIAAFTVENCQFVNNTIANEDSALGIGGGAIYFDPLVSLTGINVSISNSSFFMNNAFVPNTQSRGLGGSILFQNRYQSQNTFFQVINCMFAGNQATGGAGVVLLHNLPSQNIHFLVQGSTFRNNTIYSDNNGGGALAVVFNSSVSFFTFKIESCIFEENTAEAGGAVFICCTRDSDSGHVEITNSIFSKNLANNGMDVGGGSILVGFPHFVDTLTVSNFYISVKSCEFVENQSIDGGGGAISVTYYGYSSPFNCSHVISDTSFRNNSALGHSQHGGGAVLILISSGSGKNIHTSITNTTFEDNLSQSSGGAMEITMPFDDMLPSPSCIQCIQVNNNSQWLPQENCGFPIEPRYCQQQVTSLNQVQMAYIPFNPSSTTLIQNSTFSRNLAKSGTSSGGGLLMRNGLIKIKDSKFQGNIASFLGGAMSVGGTAQLEMSGVVTMDQGNTASAQTVLSVSAIGSITINGTFNIVGFVPPPSLVTAESSTSFDPIILGEVGNFTVTESSRWNITCPPGFSASNPSLMSVRTLAKGFTSQMLSNNIHVSCIPCASPTYSIRSGSVQFLPNNTNILNPITCIECPHGGYCVGNNTVLSESDFWGVPDEIEGIWIFALCPAGYCCNAGGNKLGCHPRNAEACAPGRDPNVPLCGSCLPGYSKDLRGPGCTLTADCKAAGWFWPLVLLFCVAFTFYVLVSSKRSKKRRAVLWYIPVLAFFVQNVSLIYDAAGPWPAQLNVGVVTVLQGVFNMHFSSDNGNSGGEWEKICAVPSLTHDDGAIAIRLIIPALVMLLLILCLILWKVRAVMMGPEYRKHHSFDRFGGAALKTMLLTYTTIASVMSNLLHCDVVGDYGLRMFRSGSVQCFTKWQIALFILGGIPVIIIPILLYFYHRSLRQKFSQNKWAELPAVQQSLEGPYRRKIAWFWAAYTLCRRLLVAIVAAFLGRDPSLQSIAFCLLFTAYLVIQVHVKPFKHPHGNITETISLIVLLVTSLCSIRTGALASAGVDDMSYVKGSASTSPVDVISFGLDVAQEVLFFVPVVVGSMLAGPFVINKIKVFYLKKMKKSPKVTENVNGVTLEIN